MTDRCLDAQQLAAFAERKLRRSEMPAVLAHLETCPTCMSALKAAMDLMEPREQSRRWLAIAAAIAVLLGIAPLVRRAMQSTPAEQLVRLAPKSARTVEARLSGGFAWAPYRGPMRSVDSATEAQRMKLVGAAGELVERADANKSADAQHAAGIGLVLVEKPEDAIARLEAATKGSSNDARAWSDLAAAEYMAALRLGRASLYPVALAHADRALRIDAKFAEGLFNRALILERLGLTQAARDAWNRYLEIDPSSQWANEAREHLSRLPASTGESLFKQEQPLLEAAALRGDARSVDAFVDRYRQQSRTWGEAEYLGRWGEAVERGDTIEANRQLTIARAIGDSLVRLSGETLLHDAAAYTSPSIAEAHAVYRRGRMTYSRREPAAAEADLRRAAMLFGNDPMALVARYYAASTRFDRNDVATARRELEALRDETKYAALGAQIRWELALCAITDDDWSATATLSAEAASTFERLGETSNLAFMQAILGTALISLGRPDEGWAVRLDAFAHQSREGRGDRLPQSLGDAARVELRNGRPESARALLSLEEAAYRGTGDDAELSNALVREALIGVGDASGNARDAMAAAQRIKDPAFRQRAVADATFAAAAVALQADPGRARELVSQALERYRATQNAFYVPEALLLRARASLRLGAGDEALRDLEEGLAAVERHHSAVAGRVLGSGVVDVRRELFEEAVALRLARGDVAGAFADSERARERLSWSDDHAAPDVATLQNKLAGTDAAVLELVVLPRELVAFCVTADHIEVSRQPLRDVATLSDGELYELLIRPSERSLAQVRQLIVVADPELQQIPFAALRNAATNRRLIETMTVALAPSARVLAVARPASASRSAVAIALPTGEHNVALPEAEGELADLRSAYRTLREIPSENASLVALDEAALHAKVLHIAGHTARRPGLGEDALLFRGAGDAVEPVTWSRIASMTLAQPVVVLAACETLRVPASPQAHALSLGGGFLAAGATDVIGTLTPVADNEARAIFRTVHRGLARGESAATAVQNAQLEAIAADSGGWRAVALLTNRIEPAR